MILLRLLLLVCLTCLPATGKADKHATLLPLFDLREPGAAESWHLNIYKERPEGGKGTARFQSEPASSYGQVGRLTSSAAGKFNLVSPAFSLSLNESPIGFRIEYRTGKNSSDLSLVLCDSNNHIYSAPLPSSDGMWKSITFTRFPNFAKSTPPLDLRNVQKLYFRGADSVDLSVATVHVISGEREIPFTVHTRPVVTPASVSTAPKLDGVLDEATWQEGTLLPALSVATGPLDKDAFPTEIRALRVGKRLYLGAKLNGEPEPTRKQTISDHDIWKDSSLEVYLEPSRGEGPAYQLIVNANNIRQDYRNSDVTWNGAWKSAVVIGKQGWTVEMEIDLTSVDSNWNDSSLWRWNITRNVVVPDAPVKHHIALRTGLSGTGNILNSQSALLAFNPTRQTPAPESFSIIKTGPESYTLLLPPSPTQEETRKEGRLLRIADERSDLLLQSISPTPGASTIPLQLKESGAYRFDFQQRNGHQTEVALFEFFASNPVKTRWHDIVLWPTPQKLQVGRDHVLLSQVSGIERLGEGDSFPAEHLQKEISRRYGWPVGKSDAKRDAKRAPITLSYEPQAGIPKEGYRLSVNAEGVTIRAVTGRGMYYGVRTLLNLIEESTRDLDTPLIRHVQCDDWPQNSKRILYYYLNASRYQIPTSVEAVKRYLYEEVAGGRYNLLFLMVGNGYHYAAAPRLRAKHGWSREELQEIVDYARQHYVEPAPANEFPGHAEWMTGSYPEFGEEGNPGTFDLTRPEAIRTLLGCYDELLDIFQPRYFHTGGDEYRPKWTEGSPSAQERRTLLLDHWKQLHAHLASKKVKMVMFDDMLSPKWNGGPPLNAATLLKDLPRDIILCSWTDRGIENSPAFYKQLGFSDVWKVTTSFDPQRADRSLSWWKEYDGLGLGLFVPWPWSSFAHYRYDTHVKYTSAALHLNALLLWHPDALAQGANYLIENEGRHWMRTLSPPRFGRVGLQVKPLTLPTHAAAPPLLRTALAGFQDETIGETPYRFQTSPERIAKTTPDTPVTLRVGKKVNGLSFLHTTAVEKERLPELYQAFRLTNRHPYGLEIGSYEIRFEDGNVESVPIVLGYNIHFFDATNLARIMGGSPAFFTGTPPEQAHVAPSAWVLTWRNPRPQTRVSEIRLLCTSEPTPIALLGINTIEPAP